MGLSLGQLKQVFRRLARTPLFTVITLITVAIGISQPLPTSVKATGTIPHAISNQTAISEAPDGSSSRRSRCGSRPNR